MLSPFQQMEPESICPKNVETSSAGLNDPQGSPSSNKQALGIMEEEQKNADTTSAASLPNPQRGNDGKYKSCLRPRKITNYREQFDISSPFHSDAEHSQDNNYSNSYGSCVLPDSIHSLKHLIEQCNSEIKTLERQFIEQEFADTSKRLFHLF